MKKPAFSVIIASHHRHSGLRRALHSLLTQTFPCHEIILVSDVSDEGTYQVANTLLRKGDIFLQCAGIHGPSDSRNLALKLATGSDIIFLDDDDAFKPEFLANLAVIQMQSSGQEILFTNFEVIDGDEHSQPVQGDLAPFSLEQIWIKNFIPNNCLIYPAFSLKGLSFDRTIAYEDWDFLLSAHARAPLRHVPINGPLIYKNSTDGQAHRGEENNTHLLDCYVKTYRKHPATPAIREQRKALFGSLGIDIEALLCG